MRHRFIIPARINILGNPSDALEGDFATLSMAVNLFAGAEVEASDRLVFEMSGPPGKKELNPAELACQVFTLPQLPLPYDGCLDLVKGALNQLYQYSPELRAKLPQQGFKISIWTEVPRQSGLGGSSLIVLLTLAALRTFYQLDPHFHNDYILSELTQRVESIELGITCGFADRYVPLFGGLGYLDYRGKLFHKDLGHEPYVTYERLDAWADRLALVAVSTGLIRDSGDVHSPMRARYLEQHAAWMASPQELPPMLKFMDGVWETAWKGKIALLHADMPAFGRCMNVNHRLVNDMMIYCGFDGGAGWANNLFIETAMENGALGAKLTGAGQGGSVFALVHPGEEDKLAQVWQAVADKNGLDQAYIYFPRLAPHGLKVEQAG
jgi:galactokinase